MLGEIQSLLKEHGRMSLRDLSVALAITPEALEPMLELLERKKRVCVEDFGCVTGCAGCSCASRADMRYYSLAD